MRNSRKNAVLLLAFLFCVGAADAQTILGSVSGAVSDDSGAVVPNASVVVSSIDRGERRTASTDSSGNYVVPSLLPGRYSLSVTAAGFKMFVQRDFRLLVNEPQTINVRLEVGDVSQAVTVTDQPAPLNQVNATLSSTVQNQEINELPLNGRHFTQLLELSPGVVMRQGGQQTGFTISLGAGGVSPVINGMRPQSNNFTLDGVENNSRYTNTYASSPPPDAIQEFKLTTQDNDPQSALAAGGGINVTTKSGSKEFHGSFWEFLRNDKLSANGFFNNFYGNEKVPYRQNQYGLVFGGPVLIPKVMDGRRTNTYFLGYWEGFQSRRTSTGIANLPDQAVRGGDFSQFLGPSAGLDGEGNAVPRGQIYDILTTRACAACAARFIRAPFPGNRIPAARISPQAVALMNYFLPMPNRAGASPNFTRTATTAQNSDQYGGRVDHNFTDNQRIFGRFSAYDAREIQPQTLPTIQFQQLNTGLNGVVHFTNIFSPTFLLDAHYGYNRTGIPRFTSGFGPDLAKALGTKLTYQVRGQDLAPQIAYSGSIYSAISPLLYQDLGNPEYSHQLAANFKKIIASHQLTFGVSYMRWNHVVGPQGNTGLTFANTASNQPGFNTSGDAFASFLLGFPTAAANNVLTPLNTYGDVYLAYAGDTWKPAKNLSVNLGVQYVLATRPVDREDRLGMFDFMKALTQPAATDYGFAYVWAGENPITKQPANASRSLLLSGDHNNFAPRVGIAWSVTPKTVIRSGFGIYYDYNTSLVQNSVRIVAGSYPYGTAQSVSAQNTLQLGPQNPAITLADPFTPPVALGANPAQTISRYMPDPYSLGWNIGVERLLPGNIVFDVHYVGGGGKNLLHTILQNTAPAGTGPIASRRPLPNASGLAWRDNTGFSTYNSLQVRFEKRYSRGLTFRNAFTWSRTFDTQSEANQTSVEYVYNRGLSHGPSDYDQPLGNVTTVIWELPKWHNPVIGGWQVSGLALLRSGVPFSILSGVDNGNTGGSVGTMVADIVRDPFPAGFKTRTAWFSKTAFATPAFGTLGNTSRNMFRGPSFWDLTMSASKSFRIAERARLEFRGEFFNALNHTNYGNPNGILTNANFGQILAAFGGRDIQLGLKLVY